MMTKLAPDALNGFKFDPNIRYQSKSDPHVNVVLPRAIRGSDQIPTKERSGPHITAELP